MPARSPRRSRAPRIGGRTPARPRPCCCRRTSCTSRTTRTSCDTGTRRRPSRARDARQSLTGRHARAITRFGADPMASLTHAHAAPHSMAEPRGGSAVQRNLVIGLVAFLTVVDLFATQAILPSLARAYGVMPAAMGLAVNASTVGMALAGLAVAFFSRRIDRRTGIVASLALLAIPTSLLALAPDLATFTALRIVQGLCMAAAFTLTLAYLGERCSMADAAGAFAAYVTGNVASNLFGRLLSAGLADHLGLQTTFVALAGLNLAGAALVWFGLTHATPVMAHGPGQRSPLSIWAEHLRNPLLRPSFAIGFCILFAFIGTFTYVNFVLVREPLNLGPMALGFVYLVFAPSLATTLLAGRAIQAVGTRLALWSGLSIAAAGLPLLLVSSLPMVLTGLTLIGIGTFFAQATATGFVSRTATTDR